MRAYAPVTVADLTTLFHDGAFHPASAFYLTEEFIDENPELDQEECEYLLSVQAAKSALGDRDFALIIAAEVEQIGEIGKSEVECVFECVPSEDKDEIDLIWFGVSEIESNLHSWSVR